MTNAVSSMPTYSSAEHATRLVRMSRWVGAMAVLPVVVWMCFAPLSMAVVAPGVVKVDLNRRPVQHLEGGIVREVLVRDGQRVRAGDPLLILGDVSVDADRLRVDFRVRVDVATVARLEAEQRLADAFVISDDLRAAADSDPRVRDAIAKESEIFQGRRRALTQEITLLREQSRHIADEVTAVKARIVQSEESYRLQKADLDANRSLVDSGFLSPMRLAQIEATVRDYAAKLEEQRTELARAEQRLVDNELRIRAAFETYRNTASEQLKVTAERLGEVEQEQRKSKDAYDRQAITAPVDGEIMGLKVTTPGAVVRPGEVIADVVPSNAKLMVEAQIRPEDVAHVRVGQAARLKFTAFKYRDASMVAGSVTYVSADRLEDPRSQVPYYSVLIQADAAVMDETGESPIQAGMPAEVYLQGRQQTPMEYLLEPVLSTVRRAGR